MFNPLELLNYTENCINFIIILVLYAKKVVRRSFILKKKTCYFERQRIFIKESSITFFYLHI